MPRCNGANSSLVHKTFLTYHTGSSKIERPINSRVEHTVYRVQLCVMRVTAQHSGSLDTVFFSILIIKVYKSQTG